MAIQPRIITPVLRIRPLCSGSRWQSRADAYQRFPLRFAWLPMELVRRHWLVSTNIEQRFTSHNHRWKVRLAIDARRASGPQAAEMIHHRQTTVLERSAFTREHRGCEVLSNLLQVYREQSVLRIEREHAVIAGILKPAIRALEAPQSGPPQRAQAAVMPAMAAVALTRVERIESVLIETSRRQFVTRPAPPAAGLTAAEQAPPAASRFARAVPETRPAASPAMTPVDLERLTDRLMRNIDRRLVASRERNGRT